MFRPKPGTHLRVSPVSAGHAFGKAQRTSILLPRVVDGFERSGPNPLHVPEVEKFMRGNVGELRFGNYVDGGRVRVLHSAAGALCIFAHVKNENVMVERSTAHQLDFIFADFAQRISHARLFPSIPVNPTSTSRFA